MTPQDKAKQAWEEKASFFEKDGHHIITSEDYLDGISDYKEALREAVMKRFETGEPFTLLELLDTVLPKEK